MALGLDHYMNSHPHLTKCFTVARDSSGITDGYCADLTYVIAVQGDGRAHAMAQALC